jgi:hypothetical protein
LVRFSEQAGFEARFTGAAISVFEMSLIPKRFDAIMDRRLPPLSRRFLSELAFSERGVPLIDGTVAGVDACFELTRP